MINFEQFVTYCNCGEEIRTNANKIATCSKCGKKYEIEFLIKGYLFPKDKNKEKQIASIN